MDRRESDSQAENDLATKPMESPAPSPSNLFRTYHDPGLPLVEKESIQGSSQTYFVYSERPNTVLGATSKNVILFGETGVGKSSVINMMAGRDVALTSSNLDACTLQATDYSFTLSEPNIPFHIFDTVGLEESEMGLNKFIGAIEKARKLISDLNKAGGIDLLVFCVKAGRLTVAMQRTYRLFYEILCNKSVPLALIITNLENEPVMEDWWKRNELTFQNYGVSAVAHACITALPADVILYAGKRDESQKALQKLFRDALNNHEASYKQDIRDFLSSFIEKLRSLLMNRTFIRKRTIMRELQARCGFPRGEARRLADIIIMKG